VVATLPVGYSHGYKVAFSNRSDVLIGGKRCPVLGRVTMDQILVNVNPAGRTKRWEEAVLIGRQGKAGIPAEELAAHADTIPYEIVCSVHPRIPRFYKN
jgi:alanine racemase